MGGRNGGEAVVGVFRIYLTYIRVSIRSVLRHVGRHRHRVVEGNKIGGCYGACIGSSNGGVRQQWVSLHS